MKKVPSRSNGDPEKRVIPYLMAGDPDLKTTAALLRSAKKAGAWAIELGIPFSDPMADGPVIQKASSRAMSKDTSLKSILGWLETIPAGDRPPVYLMTYFNLFLSMGLETFVRKAVAAGGIRGAVIPDLSFEDSSEVRRVFRKAGLSLVPFIAPTTSQDRMRKIVATGEDFIYFVSLLGTTGKELSDPRDVGRHVSLIKSMTQVPVCVGFGIQSPETVREILDVADGVIIGSRLVREENDPVRWGKLLSSFIQAARSVRFSGKRSTERSVRERSH